jgi:glycosyltransferase involved in cell wall biosynthesis
LYNVLKDLSKQRLLPTRVIIIEQNPSPKSTSELDYLEKERWPFSIVHHFTHRTGACNARNIALSEVKSDWFFLADDDIAFGDNLLNSFLESVKKHGVKAVVASCLMPNEPQTYTITSQSPIFGSGCSMVKSELLNRIMFNMNYEHGFGEDSDFGMQIKDCGEDVLYDASIRITHLKALAGGFRTVIKQEWDEDFIQPKPSPTIMHLRQTYTTKEQLQGYKLLLFVKHYRNQRILNPFKYVKHMKQMWERSIYWSNKLAQNEAVQSHI